jgi:DNA polymerase
MSRQPTTEATPQPDFTDVCAAFVRDTIARIARQQETVPAQGDIFAVEEVFPTLDVVGKDNVLDELADQVADCTRCQLHSGRTQTVFGTGSSDADLVLIGEAPGVEEDRQGLPFVGRSGQLLTEILRAIGFAREEVYICNILKCRPPENRDPDRAEVTACEQYLQQQLEIIEPKLILCLGRVAAQTLLGTRATLGALRDTVHFYAGIPVMATFHPAALLRNVHFKRPCWDDVRKVRALYDALRAPEP